MKIMKTLIEESNRILDDAMVKYDQAADDIDAVNNSLQSFKFGVNQMLDESTAEHETWKSNIRAGVYAGAGGATVGLLVADILGCLGFCTAIGTTSTWAASATIVETKINQVTAKLGELKQTIDNSVEDVDSIIRGTRDISTFIQEETEVLIQWDNAANHLAGKLDNVKKEQFYRLSLQRKSFTNALKGLRDVATEFWKRPDGIFGRPLLEEKLSDPVERSQNLEAIKNTEELRASLE